MTFHDLEIRAWLRDGHVSSLVHSSPAGSMRSPVSVPAEEAYLVEARRLFRQTALPSSADLIEAGERLAALILPGPALALMDASLVRLTAQAGLRVRLCLDEALVDLPWEILHVRAGAMLRGGHLVLDERISLVREASRPTGQPASVSRKRRLLFAGAPLLADGMDYYSVEEERGELMHALESAKDLLETASAVSASEGFETALGSTPIDIFHYSGHAEVMNGKGTIIERVQVEPPDGPGYIAFELPAFLRPGGRSRVYVDPLSSAKLAMLLRRAETRLAVFSACNSGDWPVVSPLLEAGVPAVVGVQGLVYTKAAVAFCEKLYASLAAGLSLDEAVTWARLHLLEPGVLPQEFAYQWSVFMVYMTATEAVLLPRADAEALKDRQEHLRKDRQQTISTVINLTQNIQTVAPGGVVTGFEGQVRVPPAQ
ncbi:CHAT domain-containing protein [Sorangium sp. So ce1182]|uniref:CHAT domain-containing protein n=1 Tax=Sorangium sp. So ce1182 TaxID=3133334 RepID=UPI003F5EDD8A